MIYISYLGVFDGQNFEKANTPDQIGTSFNAGFACMVNAWRFNNTLCVGSANDPIEVTDKFLQGPFMFINVQNVDLQNWIVTQPANKYPNYFWFPTDNENTNVTTSSGQIITPGSVPFNNQSIVYLPEITDRGLFSTVKYKCFGVISNYVKFIKRMRNEGIWY